MTTTELLHECIFYTTVNTFEPGIHRCMNSAMSRQEPVPDRDCTAATLLSAMASQLSPYANLIDTWLKSFNPPIGKYLPRAVHNQMIQTFLGTAHRLHA